MTVEFTEAGIAVQNAHKFSDRVHNFSRDPHQNLTTIRTLEIHPASMRPQCGANTPLPGSFQIYFLPTTLGERTRVWGQMADKLGMRPHGSLYENSFTFAPKDGVITHKLVQDVLVSLHEAKALAPHHVTAAAQTFGIPAPDLSKQQPPVEPTRPADFLIAPSLNKMLFGK